MPQRSSSHLLLHLIALLALLIASSACDRVEVRAIEETTTQERTEESVLVIALTPRFFSRVSSTTYARLRDAAAWSWADASVNTTIDGDVELNLGTLDADFQLTALTLAPEDGVLDVTAVFDTGPILTRVRIGPPEDTILCALNLDLQARTLGFTLRPNPASPVLTWDAAVTHSLTAEQIVAHSLPTECPYPVDKLDWTLLSERIDELLAGEVENVLLPKMKALVARELAMPAAGFLMDASASGFFEPLEVTVATSVAASPPWPGHAVDISPNQGVRAAFDMGMRGSTAACVGDLTAAPLVTSPVSASSIPSKAPNGLAYDLTIALDRGMLDGLVKQLTVSGYGCGDLPFATLGGLPALNALIPEIDNMRAFDFGREGRLRFQQLEAPTLRSPESGRLEWTLPRVRFSLYGRDADVVIVGLSTITASVIVGVSPTIDSGGTLRFVVEDVGARDVSANLDILEAEGVALDGATIAERLTSALVESGLSLPLSQPFGFPMAVVDVEERGGALWLYFELAVAE